MSNRTLEKRWVSGHCIFSKTLAVWVSATLGYLSLATFPLCVVRLVLEHVFLASEWCFLFSEVDYETQLSDYESRPPGLRSEIRIVAVDIRVSKLPI